MGSFFIVGFVGFLFYWGNVTRLDCFYMVFRLLLNIFLSFFSNMERNFRRLANIYALFRHYNNPWIFRIVRFTPENLSIFRIMLLLGLFWFNTSISGYFINFVVVNYSKNFILGRHLVIFITKDEFCGNLLLWCILKLFHLKIGNIRIALTIILNQLKFFSLRRWLIVKHLVKRRILRFQNFTLLLYLRNLFINLI